MPFLQTKNVIPVGGKNDVPICMSVYVKHYYLYLYLCEYILDIYIYVIMFDHMSVFLYPYTIHKYICMDICMYVYIYMHVCTCVIIYLHGWHCLKIRTRFIIDSISYVQTQRLHNRERKGTCFFDILHVEAKLCVYIYNLNKCQLPIQQKVASCNRTFCEC
jgi:hypothetical protein